MLTIVVSCILSAGMTFTPVAPWKVREIVGAPTVQLVTTLCMTYPCPPREPRDEPKPHFVLEATLTGEEQVDVPAGCTLVSLKQAKE